LLLAKDTPGDNVPTFTPYLVPLPPKTPLETLSADDIAALYKALPATDQAVLSATILAMLATVE